MLSDPAQIQQVSYRPSPGCLSLTSPQYLPSCIALVLQPKQGPAYSKDLLGK